MTWRTSITTALLNKERERDKERFTLCQGQDGELMKAWKEIDGRQMDKFLTCLAGDQIVDGGAAVNTVTPRTDGRFCKMTRIPLVLFLTQTDVSVMLLSESLQLTATLLLSDLDWDPLILLIIVRDSSQWWKMLVCLCLASKCVCRLTAVGVLGAVRLRKDRRCWLRSENLRMDSLLREASERRELVLLKSPVPSSPLVDKRLTTPWRERRTFPTHPDTWEWATDILSPKYSITNNHWEEQLSQKWVW